MNLLEEDVNAQGKNRIGSKDLERNSAEGEQMSSKLKIAGKEHYSVCLRHWHTSKS